MSSNEADAGDERIIDQFLIRRKRRNLTLGILLLLLSLGLPCSLYFLDENTSIGVPKSLGIVFIAILFASLAIFEVLNWRCPSCRRYLGREDNPVYCPHCNTRLKY
jgi:hypothetical protein